MINYTYHLTLAETNEDHGNDDDEDNTNTSTNSDSNNLIPSQD